MSHSLRNQTVLVTGGGSGIGRLLALGAAERGARVIVWDLSEEAGGNVSKEIVAAGHPAEAYTVDVSDRDSVQAAAKETGPVDVLINNAGIVTGKNLLDASDDGRPTPLRLSAGGRDGGRQHLGRDVGGGVRAGQAR